MAGPSAPGSATRPICVEFIVVNARISRSKKNGSIMLTSNNFTCRQFADLPAMSAVCARDRAFTPVASTGIPWLGMTGQSSVPELAGSVSNRWQQGRRNAAEMVES